MTVHPIDRDRFDRVFTENVIEIGDVLMQVGGDYFTAYSLAFIPAGEVWSGEDGSTIAGPYLEAIETGLEELPAAKAEGRVITVQNGDVIEIGSTPFTVTLDGQAIPRLEFSEQA